MTTEIAQKLEFILSGTGASKEEFNEIIDLMEEYKKSDSQIENKLSIDESKEDDWIDLNEMSPSIELKTRKTYTELFEVKFVDGSIGKILYGCSGAPNEGNGWFSHGLPRFTHWRNIKN